MLPGPVFVATFDGGGVDGTMAGAVLGVAQALSAAGMEQVGGGHGTGTDGGIGLEGNGNEAELQQARPTGPACDRGGGRAQRSEGSRDVKGGLGARPAHGVLQEKRDSA